MGQRHLGDLDHRTVLLVAMDRPLGQDKASRRANTLMMRRNNRVLEDMGRKEDFEADKGRYEE